MAVKLEVGKTYKNGWGTSLRIVEAPHVGCRWYRDESDSYYHEDGAMAQLDGNPRNNLIEEVVK